ncbi:LOW QUALITY PROTEIN: potassium channel subfamily U member 1 [Ara ararauna]
MYSFNQVLQSSLCNSGSCIVGCGNITLESVTTFLRDFLLQDKGNVCTEILLLGESLNLELEAVFKCHSPYMTFFYDSALNSEDLKSAGMESVDAHLILEDVHSLRPYTEDTSNIMSTKRKYLKDRLLLEDKDYKVMTFQLSSDLADLTFIEMKLHWNTVGLLITHALAEVTRAQFYCKACHIHVQNPEQIKRWQWKSRLCSKPFSDAVFRARALGNQSQPCYKRIHITTELKFSPNVWFVHQAPSGNYETPEQDQLFTTGAPPGAIFSDCFLNSLLSGQDSSFGDTYCRALDLSGMLCFGLFIN